MQASINEHLSAVGIQIEYKLISFHTVFSDIVPKTPPISCGRCGACRSLHGTQDPAAVMLDSGRSMRHHKAGDGRREAGALHAG
jgi:hypothetical protein